MNRHLRRTRAAVGPAVLLFCAARVHTGGRFLLTELELHCAAWTQATPGTASRVLRQLRAQGTLRYRVSCGVYVIGRVDPSAVEDAARQRDLFRDETSGPAR